MDPEAFATALACIYGPARAAGAPDDFTVHLYNGDPDLGGVEISDETEVDDGMGGTEFVPNGYAAASLDSDDFTADDVGMTAPVQYADALEEWEEATHARLKDTVTGFWWNAVPLAGPVIVSEAGPVEPAYFTIFFADSITEE